MTEITLNDSDRRILAECADRLGLSPKDALHEAVSRLHASLTEALPRTSTEDEDGLAKSVTAGHAASGKVDPMLDEEHPRGRGDLWDAAREGIRDGLRDARHLPRRYFAPLIALAYWMHDVTEGVMNRKRP